MRPALDSAKKVRDFLLGRWSVVKTLDYRLGGGRGTIKGEATICPADDGVLENVLLYDERGKMTLEETSKPIDVYRRYCFDTSVWPVAVCFVHMLMRWTSLSHFYKL